MQLKQYIRVILIPTTRIIRNQINALRTADDRFATYLSEFPHLARMRTCKLSYPLTA